VQSPLQLGAQCALVGSGRQRAKTTDTRRRQRPKT